MASLDGLSTGASSKLVITGPDGVENFIQLESFTSREDSPIIKKVAMDGTVRNAKLPQGWSGTLTFLRGGPQIDNYINEFARNYRLGGDQLNLTITHTINELDGSVTKFTYSGVVLELTDAGNWSGTDIVSQTINFTATARN
ncbi:MAG TPA: hypothetical protein PLF59_08175 [Cyclobacteriaceae bacterium]|nr:hypothetical protein [Cyclobacteriaceae bacterium]